MQNIFWIILIALIAGSCTIQERQMLDIDPDLDSAIINAADWVIDMQKDDGSYTYLYYPENDSVSDKDNILRQTGTMYSMVLAYNYLHEDKYFLAAEKTAGYLADQVAYSDNLTYIVDFDGEVKLGGSALAIIALLEYNDHAKDPEIYNLVYKLGDFILYMQSPEGFYWSYYPVNHTGPNKISEIYPGEAMLALATLYSQTSDDRYLVSLDSAYRFFNMTFDNHKSEAFVPWTTSAYAMLYEKTKNKDYMDFVFKLNDWLITRQYQPDDVLPEYAGGFRKGDDPLPGISTANYLEGLIDAYKLAVITDDKDRIESYGESIKNGVRFMQTLQYDSNNSKDFVDSSKVIGAYRANPGKYNVRIDFTQHALVSLIRLKSL
ncbi:MAG: hypothetical protein ABIC04_08455 [Nanoarchaeota archaeon]